MSHDPQSPSDAADHDPREASMGPDYTRKGIFIYHNCYKCKHGAIDCPYGGSHNCEYPHARND